VALVSVVVEVVGEVEATLGSAVVFVEEETLTPAVVVVLVVAPAVVVVSAAVVVVGLEVVFNSETWKLALTVLLLIGCTGRKFPKFAEVSLFLRLRRRFI